MNKLSKLARRCALALGALALGAAAHAQPSSSTKPIRVVVPFGPGGVADLTVRTVAQKMSQSMGQSIIVDNKPGAGGVVAADTVAKAPPDGLTVLLMSNGTAVSAGLFERLPFDTLKDFAPVSTLGYFDMAVVTDANSKFKSMQELLAYAKANPGTLNIGSINVGSTQHLAAELFKRSAGIDVQVVPFNGSPAMITALRGGQIDAGIAGGMSRSVLFRRIVWPQLVRHALPSRLQQVAARPSGQVAGNRGFDVDGSHSKNPRIVAPVQDG